MEPEKRRKIYDINHNLDSVLNLEQQYYDQGFEQGQEESTKLQYLEGKEFGYQTGFQRFLIVGYIKGLIDYWQLNSHNYDVASLNNHLTSSRHLLNQISTSNNEKDVENYEKLINKLRNKIRIITNLVKEQSKFRDIDKLIQEIGGNVSINENAEDMW